MYKTFFSLSNKQEVALHLPNFNEMPIERIHEILRSQLEVLRAIHGRVSREDFLFKPIQKMLDMIAMKYRQGTRREKQILLKILFQTEDLLRDDLGVNKNWQHHIDAYVHLIEEVETQAIDEGFWVRVVGYINLMVATLLALDILWIGVAALSAGLSPFGAVIVALCLLFLSVEFVISLIKANFFLKDGWREGERAVGWQVIDRAMGAVLSVAQDVQAEEEEASHALNLEAESEDPQNQDQEPVPEEINLCPVYLPNGYASFKC